MAVGEESTPLAELLERAARGTELTRQELSVLSHDAEVHAVSNVLRSMGWEPVGTLEERIEWLRRTVRLCPKCSVEVDGRSINARVRLEELWRFYLPLCSMLNAISVRAPAIRALVGIAGPPGSGKSVLAAVLQRLLETGWESGRYLAAVVPLDGFHFPNTYLDTHHVVGTDGVRQALRLRKGAPETFDVRAFLEAVELLQREPTLALPRYDRRTHDPVSGGITVLPHQGLVLLEGNYLLLDSDGWKELSEKLDLRLFVTMPLSAIKPHLIERHVRGTLPTAAARHFQRVDEPNYHLCMNSSKRADLVIVRSEDHRISSVMTAG